MIIGQWHFLNMTQQWKCTHKLTGIVTACTNPVQTQVDNEPLTEEVSEIDSFWEKQLVFFKCIALGELTTLQQKATHKNKQELKSRLGRYIKMGICKVS